MIETRPNLHHSWYDYNWDWALILLLAFVLLAGIVVLWTYADHSQTAAIPDDATMGQSTRPSSTTRDGAATIIIGSGRCEIAAGPAG